MTKFLVGLAAVVVIVVSLIGLATHVHSVRDLKCKEQFGKDYSYTHRSATDCIDNNGNGKFLKDL